MDMFAVSCHNCFSHKRQFYVFMQCKHFICLSCCLCLADFQNLTVRCCHRNTKMGEELVEIMFKEINERIILKNSQIDIQRSFVNQLTNFEAKQQTYRLNLTKEYDKSKQFLRQSPNSQSTEETKIVHSFKLLEQNMYDNSRTQKLSQTTAKVSSIFGEISEPNLKTQKIVQVEQIHIQSPTFKQIGLPIQPQKVEHRYIQETKQNYVCWKNYDTTKDRILAKLNYHQQKMNSLIRQHYCCN